MLLASDQFLGSMKILMNKLFLVIALLYTVATPTALSAAAPAGISITPAVRQVTVTSGSSQTGVQFEIGNTGSTIEQYHLQLSDFMAAESRGDSALLKLDNPETSSAHRLTPWASLDKTLIEVAPGASQRVTVRINDDSTLLPGGHYGALLVTGGSGQNGSGASHVSLLESVSGLIFLTKSGGETYGLNLTGVKSDTAITDDGANLALMFQNTGNVHVVPRGIARVFDPTGKLVSQGTLNIDSAIILPQTNRSLLAKMHSVGRSELPGRYKLNVEYRRDGSETLTTSNLNFYYAPPTSIYVTIILLILTATLISISRFRIHKRRNQTAR